MVVRVTEMEEFERDFEVEWTEYTDELDLGVKENKKSRTFLRLFT